MNYRQERDQARATLAPVGSVIVCHPQYIGSGQSQADEVSQCGPWVILAACGPNDVKIGRPGDTVSDWRYIIHRSRIERVV